MAPTELGPPTDLLAHLNEHNVRYEVETELAKALPFADVVYLVRLQIERIEKDAVKERLIAEYRKFCR